MVAGLQVGSVIPGQGVRCLPSKAPWDCGRCMCFQSDSKALSDVNSIADAIFRFAQRCVREPSC